jgi:hypothetical protein
LLNQKFRMSGIKERHAGFGHVIVRVQSHAMIVTFVPSANVSMG